jgi:hypothetical protein
MKSETRGLKFEKNTFETTNKNSCKMILTAFVIYDLSALERNLNFQENIESLTTSLF